MLVFPASLSVTKNISSLILCEKHEESVSEAQLCEAVSISPLCSDEHFDSEFAHK